jgi:uncharacterized membrane protein
MSERREEIRACWPTALPSPEILAEYNEIVPGMAERILSMTERTVTGKIEATNKLAHAEIQAVKMSLSMTIGLTLLAFTASATFFALRFQEAGLAFTSLPVIFLIPSYIRSIEKNYSKYKRQ